MDTRPLPTVIGPTENTLRALLLTVLEPTAVNSYAEWAYLNLSSGGAPDPAILSALQITTADLAEIRAELRERGLVDLTCLPTAAGSAELTGARARVTAMTQTVMSGIDPSDARVAAHVLDAVRNNAEQQLA